jgi:hypothetical protein
MVGMGPLLSSTAALRALLVCFVFSHYCCVLSLCVVSTGQHTAVVSAWLQCCNLHVTQLFVAKNDV